ncbi:hypothetical protein B0H11DRAFT_1921191 [Mycena galericulata]|nr:hypothetical protein B0H11DRAFT_1941965 [Mycena galericulata]KAJ7468326.1 hypothetical protein B0H11DRAFT_1921191 [Mycena galericulata]
MSFTQPSLTTVLVGADGFIVGTPADWKPMLNVSSHPHPMQRPRILEHVEKLSAQLLSGTTNTAGSPYVLSPRWSQSSKACGSYTDVWILCGNHRVGALGIFVASLDDEEAVWLADICHPCFLNIHSEHFRCFILIDNIASDDDMLKQPGSPHATCLHATDIVLDMWSMHSKAMPLLHVIHDRVPGLALFKGNYHLLLWLQDLFHLPGMLFPMNEEQFSQVFSDLILVQKTLNTTYTEPNSFNIHILWDDTISGILRQCDDKGLMTVEQISTSEQLCHFEGGFPPV